MCYGLWVWRCCHYIVYLLIFPQFIIGVSQFNVEYYHLFVFRFGDACGERPICIPDLSTHLSRILIIIAYPSEHMDPGYAMLHDGPNFSDTVLFGV